MTPAGTQAPGTKGEWRYYGADAGSTKYSRLDHINTSNVTNLQIAWRWSSPDNKMTYLYQGRQHIVMAIGRGDDAELVAFALPRSRTTSQ